MALERTLQNWVRRGSAGDRPCDAAQGPDQRDAHNGGMHDEDASSKAVWVHLLEQASDLNDELCRENCELHREASVLRQRQLDRSRAAASPINAKATMAAKVLPRVMSHVRRALRDTDFPEPLPPTLEKAPEAIEDAVRRVMLAAADGADCGDVALASREDTAALVSEKVALKEMAAQQQERLQELELLKERLSGGTPGHWASRWAGAWRGPLSESLHQPAALAAAAAAAATGSGSTPAAAPSTLQGDGKRSGQNAPAALNLAVGDEYEVVGRKGAILRSGEDLESPLVVTLPPGSRVRVLELGVNCNRRARVAAVATPDGASAVGTQGDQTMPDAHGDAGDDAELPPASGWLSVTTKEGKALIRPAPSLAPPPPPPPPEPSSDPAPPQLPGEGDAGANSAATMASSEDAGASAQDAASPVAGGAAEGPAPIPAMGPNGHAPLVMAEASADRRSVTVSTDAWLELRGERVQRQQQIRTLEEQVEAARHEVQQLAKIRSELRQQRSEALLLRQQGNELQELAWMAEEETRCIRIEAATVQSAAHSARRQARDGLLQGEDVETASLAEQGRTSAVSATLADQCRARRKQAKLHKGPAMESEELCDVNGATDRDSLQLSPKPSSPHEVVFSIEWRRLMSERETTARELARVLQQTDELEVVLEEQRIELQASERRRQKERNSLVTALRKIAQKGGLGDSELFRMLEEEADDAQPSGGALDTDSRSGAEGQRGRGETSSKPSAPSREQKYLQKISKLEDEERRLQARLSALQANEASLNRRAVERAAALQYATSAAGDGEAPVEEHSRDEAKPKRRADIEGLIGILEGLFIENIYMGQGRRRGGGAEVIHRQAALPVTGADPVDLSRFVCEEGQESEDSEGEDAPAVASAAAMGPLPTQLSPRAALRDELGDEEEDDDGAAPDFLGGASQSQVSSFNLVSPAVTPRTRLLRSLDFGSVSVAE